MLGEGERGKKKEKGEREKEKGVGAEDLMQTCPWRESHKDACIYNIVTLPVFRNWKQLKVVFNFHDSGPVWFRSNSGLVWFKSNSIFIFQFSVLITQIQNSLLNSQTPLSLKNCKIMFGLSTQLPISTTFPQTRGPHNWHYPVLRLLLPASH